MSDTYSIKFNTGSASFEVTGPSETWVDKKVQELKELMTTAPSISAPAAPTGNSGNKKTTRKTTPKTNGGKPEDAGTTLKSLWNEEFASKVLTWVEERQGGFDKGTTKQAAILAVFLKDTAGLQHVNPSDLEFMYRKLSWATINHEAQLKNAMNRDKYFEKTASGFELVHAGLVFGRDTSKTMAKSKK